VDVQASPVRSPRPNYSFTIAFGSAPLRTDELTRATFAAIDSIRASGPTGQELAKVREGEVRSRQTALRQNRYWAGQLAFHDQTGEDPGALLDPQGDAGLMTAEAIRQAARRYLDPANYVRVTLLPETGGPP
jgi:zinc protease